MPLLFMDSAYEPSSPSGSLSAEECSSSTSGLDREGEGRPRGTKRRDKNRDAARKSRKKQTERADELHEELQCLERSNSALQKEVAALKKDLYLYETTLERHKPYCRLEGSSSPSADCEANPSPPQALNSSASSPSTSLNPKMGFKTFSYTGRTNLSSSASAPASTTGLTPAAASSSSSSPSPLTVPCSVSSAQPAPHSLFSELPAITSTNAIPVCPSLVSNPVPSPAVQFSSDSVDDNNSQRSFFTGDTFLTNLESASCKAQPLISNLVLENTHVVKQGCPVNVPGLYPCQFSRNPNSTCVPLRPPPPQYPQMFSGFTQVSLVPPSPPPPAADPYDQHVSDSPESLLSLLTVPSPLNVPPATSSSFSGSLFQPTPAFPPLPDSSKEYSLSELLEINDWILSGPGNQ